MKVDDFLRGCGAAEVKLIACKVFWNVMVEVSRTGPPGFKLYAENPGTDAIVCLWDAFPLKSSFWAHGSFCFAGHWSRRTPVTVWVFNNWVKAWLEPDALNPG